MSAGSGRGGHRHPTVRLLAVGAGLACLAASTTGHGGLPACDALRACSSDLAEQMARCCDWPARTIAQYRRMAVADFEQAPNATAMCKATYETIAYNALKFHQAGKLKELPKSCRDGAGG